MNRGPLFMLIFFLVGCGNAQEVDLKRYISQTYATAKATSTSLPPEPLYTPLPFAPSVAINPFVRFYPPGADNYAKGNCWQPDDLPDKDVLENIDLSSLFFRGVMGSAGQYWALLETPDNTIHRVGVGRVMGSHRGRVDSISQNTLSITEHIPDGLGCWTVRNVRLTLTNHE